MRGRHKILLFALYCITFLFLTAPYSEARIMVIAPHPDDDLLTTAGIIYSAVQRGEPVTVIYITNGDYLGTNYGYIREGEAVTAESYFGMGEDSLIFLGYPDAYLKTIYDNYPNSTDVLTTGIGQSSTYGNRGLGRTDYHNYRFGSHANYNRYNILTDLKDLIGTLKPDHIFVTSEYDTHTDHSASYFLTKTAAASVMASNTGYVPTLHQSVVHYGNWPPSINASTYFYEIPDFYTYTGLRWSDRESIDVPLPMQTTNYTVNPKYLAIDACASQGGATSYLGGFIHKDEFFWTENPSGGNRPPVPNAGLDQTAAEGMAVVLNGSGSFDPDGGTLNYSWTQTGGPSVQLSDPSTAAPYFIAPANLTGDQTLAFGLVVSDGLVSSLPDHVSVTVKAVSPNGNIALFSSATASSETPQYSQYAYKAIDGVADGSPGDYTKEWVSNHEKAGAWIQLSWPVPYSVNKIVLYDRPNSNDQITAGTLIFSDGSTLDTGTLNNSGAGMTYNFPAKTMASVRLRVDSTSSSTVNVGLAEFEVYGTLAGGTQYTLTTGVTPSGAGTIAVNPSQSVYSDGEQVTLTAAANSGYTFSNWSGDASGTDNPVALTMNGDKTVTAVFTALPGTLLVTPSDGITSSGVQGGPFSPSSKAYTLQNTGNTSINWTASGNRSWIGVSPVSGSLTAGASTTVTVSINTAANSLTSGIYSGTATFTNATNGNGSTTRAVTLTVNSVSYGNIASLSTATASSETPQYGQYAYKAVDGVINGSPGDYTKEWASYREKAGAWIQLTWPVPYLVDKIVLYDRPNSNDQITAGTLIFSDGSTLDTGTLNNSGTAMTYTFAAKTITSVRLRVDSTSSTTLNVGLSEFQVFGVPASALCTITAGVSPTGAGTVARNPDKASYNSGEQVTLTAAAGSGYTFGNWSGDASGTANPLAVTMDGNKTVTAVFSPIPGALSVTPAGGLTSSGVQGGPFTPSNITYTLQNTGNTTIDWTASATQAWTGVSPASGSLAPGASTTVTVSINSNANGLASGSYSDTVSFANTTNGSGDTTRAVTLAVQALYTLTTGVTPAGAGTVARNPDQSTYVDGGQVTLTAAAGSGYTFGNWSGDASGTANPLVVTMNGNKTVTAVFSPIPGALSVTPAGGLASSGTQGGPFTPSNITYTLQNTGNMTIDWTASATQAWTGVSPASGSLAAGASTTVTVSINSNANGLAAGSYSDTVSFANTTNGNGNTMRSVALTVLAPGALSVTPAGGLTSSGVQSGPFTPSSTSYTIQNTGGSTINWTASANQTWISVSPTSGSLAAGASTTVTVSINSNANGLAAGSYSDTVSFANTTNGNGNTMRSVALTVLAPGVMSVTPSGGMTSSGYQGGPFSPSSTSYTIQNTGGSTINWTSSANQTWISVSPTSGSLAAGASATVTVSINSNANGLAAGSYNGTVSFANTTNGNGNATRSVSLTVLTPGTLSVTPADGLSSSGLRGGPFSPSSKVYTLQNTGSSTISWTTSSNQVWFSVAPTSGSLAPGATATVTVTINSAANTLPQGNYSGTASFANQTNGRGNTSRLVSLKIRRK